MKLLHVTNAIGWSGGLEQMVLLLSELQKKGHTNTLVCPPGSEAVQHLSGKKVVIEFLTMSQEYDLVAAWKLKQIISRHQPLTVHAHHPRAHSLALLALSSSKTPSLVVSRRVSFPLRRNPFSKWKYRSKRIQKFVAVSQAVKEILIQGGVNSARIEVIYSAVRTDLFFPRTPNQELKKFLRIPEGFFAIGKIANYSQWKGQQIFLEAAKKCIEKNPKLIFVFAGRDTEKLTTEAEKLGLTQYVRLLGFRKDIPEILSVLDLSVNSAIQGEGLSGALRESLSMEIPVIASDVAGNREIVQDGLTGFIVPSNMPELLAEKILYALENYSLAKTLARAGREWVLQNTALPVMVEKYLRLYQDIVKSL